jgi:hypothetical protein
VSSARKGKLNVSKAVFGIERVQGRAACKSVFCVIDGWARGVRAGSSARQSAADQCRPQSNGAKHGGGFGLDTQRAAIDD